MRLPRATRWSALVTVCAWAGCQKDPDPPAPPSTARLVAPVKHPMYRIIETPPESPYEEALMDALHITMGPDAMQQICARWFPEYDRKVADAFLAWRTRNQPVLDEIRDRSTAVWNRRAGPDVAYVRMVYPHIRKQIADEMMARSDAVPVEEFKAQCAQFPAEIGTRAWELEKALRDRLRIIRQRPLAAAGQREP
jgi:hypothetical protein